MKKILSYLMLAVVLLVLGHGGAWALSCSPSASFTKIMDDPVYGIAARAVCRSEGNCNADGTITQAYCGHPDPKNNELNTGFCSNQSAGSSDLQVSDESCLNKFIKPAFEYYKRYAEGKNLTPEQKKAVLLSFVDLLVQAPKAVHIEGTSDYGLQSCLENPSLYGQNTWKVPEAGKVCLIANAIDASDRILRARVCSYIVPSKGTLAFSTGYGGDCNGETPDTCVSIWCDQSRRMSALNGTGGVLGNLPTGSIADQTPQNIANITCFSCPLIKAIIKISADLGEDIFNGLRETLVSLIGVVIALVLLYRIGTLFLPFGPTENAGKVVNQQLYLTGLGIMLCIVLSSMTYFWQYVYVPVLQSSVDISDVILQSVGGIEGYAKCPAAAVIGTVSEQSALLADRIECQTKNIVETLSQGLRVGWAMIDSMRRYEVTGNPASWINVAKNFLLIFSAIPIIAIFFYATLKFLFGMIDVVWRWTFICMISPLMIASFLTKQTRSFFGFGMKGMLESLVSFTLMSIVAAVTASLLANVDVDPSYAGKLNDPKSYIKAISDAKTFAPTLNRAAFWNITFIGLLCGGLLFKCRDLAGKLVGSVTGGAAGDFGQSILNGGTVQNIGNNIMGRAASQDVQKFQQNLKDVRQEKAYPTPKTP